VIKDASLNNKTEKLFGAEEGDLVSKYHIHAHIKEKTRERKSIKRIAENHPR
jgi:hypothetical protein